MWNIAAVLLFASFLSIFTQSSPDLERIINSTETTIEEYPFTVSIQWFKYHICGGVVISEGHVLTSARCIDTFPLSELLILAGSTQRNNYISPAQEVKFEEAIVHPDYNPITWANDIAILVLVTPLNLSGDNVKAISFYEGMNHIPSNERLTAIGWGVLVEGASFYPINLHAKFMLTSDMDHCIELLAPFGRLVDPDSMFCGFAFDPDINSLVWGGTCDGDWGGPLVTAITEDNPNMELVGLASWGFTCDQSYPHIFTNLQGMKDFIHLHIGLWPGKIII